MKILDPLKPKIILLISAFFLVSLLIYSIFIVVFDSDLLLKNVSSKEIYFNYVYLRILIGILFLAFSLFLLKLSRKTNWLSIIITTGIIVRIILIPTFPVIEDDFYRYLWDGAVTANGINPYEFAPEDVYKKTLIDEVPPQIYELANESGDVVKKINHPHIRTIYPPFAQIIFAFSYLIFPWKIWGLKIVMLLFDLWILYLLYSILKEHKKTLLFIAIYWLNPIVIHEFFSSAHMDIFVLPFALLSLKYFLRQKYILSSVFLAIATGFKIWPAVFFPLILWNLWQDKKELIKNLLVFGSITAASFIPVVLTKIDKSLGFVIYAGNWYNNDAFFRSLHWFIKQIKLIGLANFDCTACIARWSLILIFSVILFFILRIKSKNNDNYFEKFLLIIAIFFLISPTQFPWYFTWVVPFLVFRPKVSLLLYPALLPLYILNYFWEYFVFVQHVPVIILFLFELKSRKFEGLFYSLKTV